MKYKSKSSHKQAGEADNSFVWFVGGGALYLFGLFHAFNAHTLGAGIVALVFPPAAFFFGIEGLLFHG